MPDNLLMFPLHGKESHQEKSRCQRAKKGSSLVELSVGLMIVVPIVLTLIDCVMIVIGVSINDSVCRDAARAAASGEPAKLETCTSRPAGPGTAPYQRVLAVINSVWISNLPMKLSQEPVIKETLKDVPPQELGGAIDGEVSVQTTMHVYPPFLVGACVGDKLNFQSTHVVNFTYVVPKPKPS